LTRVSDHDDISHRAPWLTQPTAFGAIAGKSGYKIDRETQEKITDGGRDAYEKYSG
jgi:hypothetical protein